MIDRSLIGIAGAHFVAGEMSKRGYVVTLTSRNTEGIDLLASDKNGTNPIAIQVKTTTQKNWLLNKKADNLISEDLFYIFVLLKGENEMPEFFIVPSKDVAEQVSVSHEKWLETPNKRGGKHNDSPMRVFRDNEKKYKDRWDLLGLD